MGHDVLSNNKDFACFMVCERMSFVIQLRFFSALLHMVHNIVATISFSQTIRSVSNIKHAPKLFAFVMHIMRVRTKQGAVLPLDVTWLGNLTVIISSDAPASLAKTLI